MSQINIEDQIGGKVIHLSGQFVGGTETDQLRDTLKEISNQDKNNCVVNLEHTEYLNSTALGVLISAHASFVKKDGKIILCNISKQIENIFVITKLTLVFDIAEDVEKAIEKL